MAPRWHLGGAQVSNHLGVLMWMSTMVGACKKFWGAWNGIFAKKYYPRCMHRPDFKPIILLNLEPCRCKPWHQLNVHGCKNAQNPNAHIFKSGACFMKKSNPKLYKILPFQTHFWACTFFSFVFFSKPNFEHAPYIMSEGVFGNCLMKSGTWTKIPNKISANSYS